ncbi:LysR family transcriptional regulator [Rhizobium halophytocola]|uniref:DNA-binding transcriptional LysR family regulator n=1 Tax=Rhizobium halophytocola TaxID=735519 RepID=A0ABS4DUY4_9HYPH|nr:LysR family transcriptional regulator [Rhizobium halophytocola]MBP1849487.1 DNA-binding transcriptional LysR family regulator [Rhizobium halophytocola]
MSDLNDIRVFLTVAREHSFVAAARQLSMTAPTVTRAVSALEDRLGVQLLLRTTRQVSLTSAGAVYAARIAPLLDQFEDVAEAVRAEEGHSAGLIRLNVPLSLGQRILPDVISAMRAENPGISVSLTLTDRFIDIVSGDFDLAIRISEPPRDKSTIWRKICPVTRVLVASPGYLAANGTPQSPDDLNAGACIAYDEEALSETWELTNGAKTRKVHAGRGLAGNNGEVIARLAENGEGVALLPQFIVADAIAAGSLKRILDDWRPPDLWLTLYYPPYDKLPMRVSTFSDVFETYVTATRPI